MKRILRTLRAAGKWVFGINLACFVGVSVGLGMAFNGFPIGGIAITVVSWVVFLAGGRWGKGE